MTLDAPEGLLTRAGDLDDARMPESAQRQKSSSRWRVLHERSRCVAGSLILGLLAGGAHAQT
jgi:hypothetical protein